MRFEGTGRISPEDADRLIELSDDPAAGPEGAERPLAIALAERRPAHARRWLLRRGDRGQEGQLLGAVAMFWERQGP